MKQLLIQSLISLTFLSSCVERITERKYIIENSTNHDLVIEMYGPAGFVEQYEISGSGVLYERVIDDEESKPIFPAIALNADSIVLYFNDDRRQIYYETTKIGSQPNTTHNIFKDEAYSQESNTLYRFVITEDDYLNAEEL